MLSTSITAATPSVQLTVKTNATRGDLWTKYKLTVLIPVPLGTRFNWPRGAVSRSTPWSCFVSTWRVEGMHLSHGGSHHGPPAARPLSPAGSADVICQTKTYIYTGCTDEIRGPKADLSAAIRGEEPANFTSPSLPVSYSPIALSDCSRFV